MKIRIKGNTLRYRLSKPDIAALIENGGLEDETTFLTTTLKYAITKTDNAELNADFVDNCITLYVPEKALQQWAATELVALDHNILFKHGGNLNLLLEKDFKCVDAGITEDQSDFFENPYLAC